MKSLVKAATLVGALLTANAALAQDITHNNNPGTLIRGAKVYTLSSRGVIESADVLVREGKIVLVGPERSVTDVPPGTQIVEAKGRAMTPGLFAGLTQIGLEEVEQEPSTVDTSLNLNAPAWEQQWRPEFDVTLAYNPRSTLVPVARVEGLTWTVLAPGDGDNIIAGQGAAVTLDGRFSAVLDGSRSLFVQLGSQGGKLSGGSRAAQYMLLDQAVREARTQDSIGQRALLHPAGRTVLARYLAGGRVVFEVDRAADILEIIGWASRTGMKPVISGGSEAWLVARELARAHVPVILNALQDLPKDFDRLGSRLDNAARLQRAGVLIAFSSGENYNARLIRQLAGNAVAHGLPWEAALAAITINPAEIFGLGGTRGRIEKGQIADFVLWDGDPLEVTTIAEQVWIAGRAVEMRSRQTELRDRYLKHRSQQ